jgi:hypothetical protein
MSEIKSGITKSQGRKHTLDKFYTKPLVAKICINSLDLSRYDYIIEPSAGSGAFSSQIENCIAFDISPEDDSIIQQDFLRYERERKIYEDVLVIGNPPFGQQNALAIRFINHAAMFATTIAFILPLSFKKKSIQNKINLDFSLVKEYELPKSAFLLDGNDYTVPSVFQVWNYLPEQPRIILPPLESTIFTFVKKSDSPDAALQRIGGNAGKASLDWKNKNEQSHYFIKFIKTRTARIDKEAFVNTVNSSVFPSRDWNVGPRSISKQEFIEVIG